MCKISRFMKSVTNTTNTKHTLTFLKSNYKYKRRVYTSMTHTHATPRGGQPQRHAANAEAETEDRCANAKNTLNNAINQIINTKRITCEIKLIFKLFILCVGQLLTHTNCHTRRHERPASDGVALTQSCQVVSSGGGGGGGGCFDDTSHQRRNYDKVSTGRCQIAQRLHQWTQRQMRQHVSQTRLAPPQQQQQQQCLYASSLACNQSSRRCNDSNWQDLSPVVARLSAKSTTTMLQRWHTSSGSARNGRINVLSTLAAILFMALAFNATPLVDAGACWRSSQSNGKCSEIYLRNSTKAECCRYPELFYTDRDVTDVEFFFTTTVGDGMTCSPCALSCKSMQCGWNKKCVKRKGRPKCVCAPECGAAKRHKQRGQPKIYRGHEPHSEQLRMNRHIVAGAFGTGGGGQEAVEGDNAAAFFNEGKSPRDIRSLSSEITNVNLGVEHQMQMQMQIQNQNQNQRKLIIMQSQSQQKPQLSRRVEKPGRLLITANVEHDTEKPVQQRIQIISNVRMNSRKHHNHFNRENFDDEFNDEDDDNENNEDDEVNGEDAADVADAETHNEENNDGDDDDDDDDLGDWLDDVVIGEEESTGNHRRSSDDSTRTPLEARRSFNLPSRHKANKNSNHNKKRRQHENEMELGKRQQENSNNNNFAIIKRFQLAAAAAGAAAQPSSSASNARRLENAPNHEEVLLPVGDTMNVNSASNGNNNYNGNKGKGKHNIDGGRQQRERHHHQQRKRKHQKQQQQQHQQQQQQHGHQHNHRAHKKHKKLKDHNANNNDNNVRTRTSASVTSSSGAQHSDNIATIITPIISTTTTTTTTIDWQTTAATTPVNSMSPSDDRRFLNHGSHIAKSLPSSPVRKQKTGASSEPFFGAGVDNVGVGVGVVDGGVAADVGKSSLNSDDSTLLDGIYEDFNVYGFPNRQFEVAVENFHGPHPVCGTDGRTYNTECQLKKRGCRTNNPALAVAYRGHCRTSCNGVKCLNGQTCVEDQYTIPHCIACKIDCPEDDAAAIAALPIDPTRAVCGVDGKTYRSVCDINRMICKSGRSVAVAYPGPCRDDRPTCSEINCGRKHTCLVDLLTLEPRCVSCSYKCARKRRPTSLRFEEGKICGVNNRTYNSWCELRRDSCNTGFLIDVKAPGECH